MWYILKQLFTSVLVKVVDIYIPHYSPPLRGIIIVNYSIEYLITIGCKQFKQIRGLYLKRLWCCSGGESKQMSGLINRVEKVILATEKRFEC